ncbi:MULTISPECIES: sensor histidine kinase [Clostridium]|uniref:sensor histidine kinase n=1 Tax=Clostridium TaxID=1485 RepID=UPI0008248B20|nr:MULTISPECIES: sensor histidine kinase [Clostridium]PJI08977.1 sensor histidine kinase [Clostridium sp. CT7]
MNKLISLWILVKPKIRYLFLMYTAFLLYTNSKIISTRSSILILLDAFLIIYTFITLNKNHDKQYSNSFFIISICIYSLIWIFGHCDNIYYFILLDDLFDIKNSKRRNIFLIFHASIFAFIICFKSLSEESFSNSINDIAFLFLIYALIIITYFSIHKLRWDRDKLKILNSNLIEYSFKEKEFLISNERNRISQELHDSIGHSLMALSMNVRYLKAIKGTQKMDKELDDIDDLVKESIDTLRNTVYNLRKLDENLCFNEQVKNIINKFNELDIVKINFDCDKSIENTSVHIKNVLLTTIKEGITNGLKHGNPNEINISVESITSNKNVPLIKLLITNNGTGCKNIIKSHGLNGITERIESVNGSVTFKSPNGKGFIIEALIKGN